MPARRPRRHPPATPRRRPPRDTVALVVALSGALLAIAVPVVLAVRPEPPGPVVLAALVERPGRFVGREVVVTGRVDRPTTSRAFHLRTRTPAERILVIPRKGVRVAFLRDDGAPVALRVTGTVDQLDEAAPRVDGHPPVGGQAVIRAGEIERVPPSAPGQGGPGGPDAG